MKRCYAWCGCWKRNGAERELEPSSTSSRCLAFGGERYTTTGGTSRDGGTFDVTLTWTASIMDVVRILLAILLPPLGVFLQVGIGLHFWLNILLTLLGYIPGIIHAIWVILRR